MLDSGEDKSAAGFISISVYTDTSLSRKFFILNLLSL